MIFYNQKVVTNDNFYWTLKILTDITIIKLWNVFSDLPKIARFLNVFTGLLGTYIPNWMLPFIDRVFPKVDHSANVARIVLVDQLLN